MPSPVLVNFSNQFGYRLVPVYIPGEGYRYLITVPSEKWNHLNTNHISDHQQQKYDKYEKYDKYNGRYNAKLKKYKAYEKFLKPQQQLKQQVMASGGCKSYLQYACKFLLLMSTQQQCGIPCTHWSDSRESSRAMQKDVEDAVMQAKANWGYANAR